MAALILLVGAESRTLRHTEALLSDRGHLVAALSSSSEADILLDSVPPDLLVANVRAAQYADLQIAIRSRVAHPDVPVIVTSVERDAIVEAEVRRVGRWRRFIDSLREA